MTRKKTRRNCVPNDFFRLLVLKQELQGDVKVMKVIVDEVDVLRLCRQLGMPMSGGGDRTKFELGKFDPSEYDADFARFIRDKLVTRVGGCDGHVDSDQAVDEQLEIGCLFGKQAEVKAELDRMGIWSRACDNLITYQDQGVYCLEFGNQCAGGRGFVAFSWLRADLFGPKTIRDTPVYVLRFLLSLSSAITCCMSRSDFELLKRVTDARFDSSSMRWQSCSVEFQVKRHMEQRDSICSTGPAKALVPQTVDIKTIQIVSGMFPAIAVESAVPSVTEWVSQDETLSCTNFADWLQEKSVNHAVELVHGDLLPMDVRNSVLSKFGYFPQSGLDESRVRMDGKLAEAVKLVGEHVTHYVNGIYDAMVDVSQMLVAIPYSPNDLEQQAACEQYDHLLDELNRYKVLDELDDQTRTALTIPERLQNSLDLLAEVFERQPAFFEEMLGCIETDNLTAISARYQNSLAGYYQSIRSFLRPVWARKLKFGPEFRCAMQQHQLKLQNAFLAVLPRVISMLSIAVRKENLQLRAKELQSQSHEERAMIKNAAFEELRAYLLIRVGRQLQSKVVIRRLTPDEAYVDAEWSKEVEKVPTKVMRLYDISSGNLAAMTLLGTAEFDPGFELRKLATSKMNQIIAVLVKDCSTVVQRIQFDVQATRSGEKKGEQHVVRTFPRACSLCSIRTQDRQVAFVFGEYLGTAALCRFNDTFTRIDVMRDIALDTSLSLTAPLVDILLTERSIYAVDIKGHVQSYDVRSRQTSKKTSLGAGEWIGGLLSFADELVVGRAIVQKDHTIRVSFISSDDHRELPAVNISDVVGSAGLGVGCAGDNLYILNAGEGAIHAYKLDVTVRSDAFRIQRFGDGGKVTRRGRGPGTNTADDASEHWLRVFYHVFEKFPVRCLIDQALLPKDSFPLDVGITMSPPLDAQEDDELLVTICRRYFHKVMVDIRRLNKPLFGLDLATSVTCGHAYQTRPVREVLTAIVSFVPVQICRAEDNMLKLLRNGRSVKDTSRTKSVSSLAGSSAAEIAQSLRFGLLSPLVESWSGRCVVVTSMGKQSTGKSYFLNNLTGTTFAIAGSRCTEGVWMSVRFLSSDMLLVVLDFEGLGSFERSEQEDVFLSVLNASVSQLTVFRMDSRFDKDVDSLFSRFQKGVQLLKKEPKLFRGLLYMSVKDVNMNDRQGVVDELSVKLDRVFEANKAQNFLTEMYAGQLVINCTPPFGTTEYYQSMENDVLKRLCHIVSLLDQPLAGFATGKTFLDCFRLVLSKISILDWTSMEKDTEHMLIVDANEKLPGILRTGCCVAHSLVADPSIPSHLKEDVVRVGTREKIVISLENVCQAYPERASMWRSLDDVVSLDDINDESLDFGFDVTMPGGTKCGTIHKALVVHFHRFLSLRGVEGDTSKLVVGYQLAFDAFLVFALRRRIMKVKQWLGDMLDDGSAKARAQLEQQHIAPFELSFARCQHRCARCQLGCMHSVVHTVEIKHDCSTNHKCRGFCEYDECQAGLPGEVPVCFRRAGHEGKCECSKGDHSCGKKCSLIQAPNCDKTCSLLADHLGDHRCSVQVHVCGAGCSAATCKSICLLDVQRKHSTHKCAEVRCIHPCLMKSCEALCCERDHFHGQATESRAFAIESGMSHAAGFSESADEAVAVAKVTHICDRAHVCGEMCVLDGICEQKVHIKKSSRTYKGSRGSFEYIHQEMNGSKKRCKHVIPAGKEDHNGLEHSCAAQSLDDEDGQDVVHFCHVRCPCCSYYCNKHVGHMGLHDTSHGNMRSTYFLAKDKDIEVRERKYEVGESGTAEMCNLFCAKMGRGHVHYLSCEGSADEMCVYAGEDASIVEQDQRRHCTDNLYPVPERAMDELLHAKFWSTIGWVDPCNETERALFAMCRFQCNAPEHEEEGKLPSYCVLDAWHQPEVRPEEGDDKFAYVDGHKFECVHAIDSGTFHNVFVLDSSGSMNGQPWQDLLYACNDFAASRLKDGGENDLVSYVTFDHESRIFCEKVPLGESNAMLVPFSGGGTSFGQGLRAASEVLSRNDFKEYKATLIFFSDGQPWDFRLGITLAQHIHSMYAKYDLKAFVVGFGRVNASVLQSVADKMGGEYRLVLDSNALKTEFNRIVAVLCGGEASLALQESRDDGT